MKKFIPYILFLVFTITFFYKCFFLGEVIFPASMFYNIEPYKSSNIGQKYKEKNNVKRQWNALTFDSALEFYPWRHYLGESYKKGQIPKNNIYSFSGKSFFTANGQSACYYPLNLFFAFVPTSIAFTSFIILHILLLQIFMYIFLKKLKLCDSASVFGAVGFAFSGFVISWLALPTFVSVITYLPLSFYFLLRTFQEKKICFGILCGISLAFSILAGHLQIAFFVCIATLIFAIYLLIKTVKNKVFNRNLVLSIILCLIIFVGISSLQLYPSLLMSKFSHRVPNISEENYNWVINNAIENWRYITAFIPKAFGCPSENNYIPIGFVSNKGQHINSASDYIEYSMYIGIASLFFAFMTLLLYKKKNIIFWWIFSLFFIYISFGGIIYKIFYYKIFGVSSFGSPARFICIGLFGLCILGAYGLDWYIKNYNEKYNNKNIKSFAPFVASGILILLFLISYGAFICGVPKEAYNVLMASINIHLISFIILIVLTYICALLVKFNPYIIVLLLFIDLFIFGANFNETCKKEYVYPKIAIIDKLKELNAPVAVINDKWSMFQAPNALLPPNMLMYYGIKEVGGYDSLFLGSYKNELENLTESISPVENGNMIMIKKPFKGLENYADYMVSLNKLDGYNKVDFVDNVYIYKLN